MISSVSSRPAFFTRPLRLVAATFMGLGAASSVATAQNATISKANLKSATLSVPTVTPRAAARGHQVCKGFPRLENAPRSMAQGTRRVAAVPVLNTRPSATAQIYIDFDGATINDPHWTENKPANCPAIPVTDAEIAYIVNLVGEDFSPFDINVTTDENRYLSAPVKKRMRVIVTSNDEFAPGAGGVAFLNSFNQAGSFFADDVPCFVFNKDPIGIAEATSHEVGHTMGLNHDGRLLPGGATEAYYLGHGTGVTSWAPIMGAAYYVNVGQWSKGEYSNANNQEDDLAIILNNNGLSYVADEAGNTIAAATQLPIANGQVAVSGVVTGGGDVDVFKFNGGGDVDLTLKGNVSNQNLDCKLEILDSNGQVVISAAPDNDLNATLKTTISPGSYFLRISGTGAPTPPATGYTAYASIGTYTLTGSIPGLYISVSDASVTEGNVGTTTMDVTVSLSRAASTDVTFDYATSDGTAQAGSDYVATSGSASIPAGQLSVKIPVTIIGDLDFEPTETFAFSISNVVGADIADAIAACAIVTDDIRPEPSGRIVYATTRDGNSEIYSDLPDGSRPVRLTNNTFNDHSPSLSPNSGRIAFISDRSGRAQLWVMSVNGGDATRLTNFTDRYPQNPCWSPDGTTIYFNDYRVVNGVGLTNLRAISASGGTVATLTTDNLSSDPAISPNGETLAFQRGANQARGELVLLDKSGVSRVLVPNAVARHVSWTNDGTAILFSRYFSEGDFDIASVDVKSGQITALTNSSEDEGRPLMSPDGAYIAYQRNSGTGFDIWIMQSDGLFAEIAIATGVNTHPAWGSGNAAPEVVSLSPANTTGPVGQARGFKAVYRDGDGVADLGFVFIQIKGAQESGNGLYAFYGVKANKLWLHDGNTWIGGINPGTKKPIVVSQGSLNCGLVTVSKTATSVTVNWNFTPSVRFTGNKNISLRVTDSADLQDGPKTLGSWNITASAAAPSSSQASEPETEAPSEAPISPSAKKS